MATGKVTKFSYSRLNTYHNCPFHYWLKYDQRHYVYSDSLAAEMGTLIHHIEETIALNIISGFSPDYEALKKEFRSINIPKSSPTDTEGGIFGIDILKKKYADEFFEMNDKGESYFTKAQEYLNSGIYRLENYLKENPKLRLVDVEKGFEVEYNGVVFFGFIDRILQNTETGEYIIEDIKTKDHPFKDSELATPLQFVIYSMALKKAYDLDYYPSTCYYDLPVCGVRQKAGTRGFVEKGLKEIGTMLNNIQSKVWDPKPTPLCHWCEFCPTNPKQTEEGKNLCCYYSMWTRENQKHDVAMPWKGIDQHDKIMAKFLQDTSSPEAVYKVFDFDF